MIFHVNTHTNDYRKLSKVAAKSFLVNHLTTPQIYSVAL